MTLEPQRSRKRERTSNPQEAGKIGQGKHVPAPVGWTKTFTDPRLCAAIVDRLTFNATIIETGTESYRLARAKAGQDA